MTPIADCRCGGRARAARRHGRKARVARRFANALGRLTAARLEAGERRMTDAAMPDQVFFANGAVAWPALLCDCLYAEIVVFAWLLSAFGFLASLLLFI